MVYKTQKKNLLFIEPFLSSQSLIYDAQVNGYGTFILSKDDSYLNFPKENFMSASTFFQVNTFDEQSVLKLVKQINQKFLINGIIPEYNNYSLLSAKIAHQLKKPGLTLRAAPRVFTCDFLAHECTSEKEYRIDGLVNNKHIFIFSLSENFLQTGLESRGVAYILRPEIDPFFFNEIMDLLQHLILSLEIDYGFFHAIIKLTTSEVQILKFKMGFAQHYIPKLINYATGINYCHAIYKLFSSQPLSLHRGKKLNVGIIFFYEEFMKQKKIKHSFENLPQNACVVEIKEYDKENTYQEHFFVSRDPKGYVIFSHEDYEVLKNHMQNIVIKSAV